jgi:hypothetical protein
MGIALLQGRAFTTADRIGSPNVAVVDEIFARKVARSGSALGVRIGVPGSDSAATIVGIVKHVKHYGLDAQSGGQIYVSHEQYPWRWMTMIVRAERDPLALVGTLRSVVQSVDPERPVFDVETVESMMDERSATRRFVLTLLAVYAGSALVLACVGLYGVIAYAIAQRRREFGIRIALGQTPGELVSMVVTEGARLVGIGIAAGAIIAVAGSRLLRSLLFDVSPLDPGVVLGAITCLAAAALLAAWIPARSAAHANPLESLSGR